MKITTVGELVQNIRFVALFAEKADAMAPKSFTDKDTNKTETKVAPDGSGRVQLRTALKALRLDDEGNAIGEEREVSLAVLEACNVDPFVQYGLSGTAWITHYQTNAGRMGVSIVVERLKPVDQINKVSVTDLSAKLSGGPVKASSN